MLTPLANQLSPLGVSQRTIPSTAILDENEEPLLDEDGDVLEEEEGDE